MWEHFCKPLYHAVYVVLVSFSQARVFRRCSYQRRYPNQIIAKITCQAHRFIYIKTLSPISNLMLRIRVNGQCAINMNRSTFKVFATTFYSHLFHMKFLIKLNLYAWLLLRIIIVVVFVVGKMVFNCVGPI